MKKDSIVQDEVKGTEAVEECVCERESRRQREKERERTVTIVWRQRGVLVCDRDFF